MRKRVRFAAVVLAGALCILSAVPAYGAGPSNTGSWRQGETGQWYYYDGEGNLCTGWIEIGGKYYYLYEDGHCAISEVTPDGYRVDGNGVWYEVTKEILGHKFSVPVGFVGAAAAGESWGGRKAALESLNGTITQTLGGGMKLAVGTDAVEYLAVKDGTRYMGLYKDHESGGYRLEMRTKLDRSSTEADQAATCHYAVFQAMLTVVSSTPEQLEAAIYSAWQEQNTYGISRTAAVQVGDCRIQYESGQGTGRFHILPPQ